MATVIDASEKLTNMTVNPFDSVIIERGAGTPADEPEVVVKLSGLSLNVGSTVVVQDHAKLSIGGSLDAGLFGTIAIGDYGTVVLHSLLTVQLDSNILFVGHDDPARLTISETKLNFLPSIAGFGANNFLQLQGVNANSEQWVQGPLGEGTLQLYRGSTLEQSIQLAGTYNSANFALQVLPSSAVAGFTTIVSYVSPDEAGFKPPAEAASKIDHSGSDTVRSLTHGSPADLSPIGHFHVMHHA